MLSTVAKTPDEADVVSPIYLDMVEDAVLLFDRDRFFARILDRVRGQLREMGAVRHRMGRFRYWELKPDHKPGEVIRID